MKWTLVLVLFAAPMLCRTQSLTVRPLVQQTVFGLQEGIGIRYQLKKYWGLGVFRQSSQGLLFRKEQPDHSVLGLEVILPLLKGQGKASVLLIPKLGLVNSNYLVPLLEIETNIKIMPALAIGTSAGIRSGNATALLHLILFVVSDGKFILSEK